MDNKAFAPNQLDKMSRMLAAEEVTFRPPLRESIGQRQATHDMASAHF